jgi:hypothetical protein
MMHAFALKVVSEKIWNNVLASDFVSVLFISILSKRIHAVGYDGRYREAVVGKARAMWAWR